MNNTSIKFVDTKGRVIAESSFTSSVYCDTIRTNGKHYKVLSREYLHMQTFLKINIKVEEIQL